MDQRGLVERARRGDHDAFTSLVDLALARLDLAARLILRDPDLARDAVQEALLRAWHYLPGLRDPDAFDGWLHRLTVNACLDLAQNRKRRLIEMDIALIETPARSDMAGDLANRDQLNDALGSLDPKHRAVVVMHFFLGMPLHGRGGRPAYSRWDGEVPSPLLARNHAGVDDRGARAGAWFDRGRTSGMTSDRRFEQELSEYLGQLSPGPMPDYRDDIVRQTARMGQRPAWTIPERWIPMASITSRVTATPNIPLRLIAFAALLIVALIVGVLVAGSRPRVPAPFGPAANGLVAYEAGGDIYTVDPVTGVAKPVVTGTQQDLRPVFSRDGTHLVFERKEAGSGRLIVARSDGSDPVVVTPEPVTGLDYPWAEMVPSYTFSPDGTEIALWSTTDAGGKLWIAQSNGNGMRQVDLPITVVAAAYRPPGGAELIVEGSMDGGKNGIYAIDAKIGTPRTIVAPAAGMSVGFGVSLGRFSPDGSRLAYVSLAGPGRWSEQHSGACHRPGWCG